MNCLTHHIKHVKDLELNIRLTVIISVCVLLFQGCEMSHPLRIAVVFENAPRIESGDPVYYKSYRVGSIIDVEQANEMRPNFKKANIEIYADYKHQIYRNMAFTIDSFRLLNRQRRIVIMDRVALPKKLAQTGDVFVGTTYFRFWLEQNSSVPAAPINSLNSTPKAQP